MLLSPWFSEHTNILSCPGPMQPKALAAIFTRVLAFTWSAQLCTMASCCPVPSRFPMPGSLPWHMALLWCLQAQLCSAGRRSCWGLFQSILHASPLIMTNFGLLPLPRPYSAPRRHHSLIVISHPPLLKPDVKQPQKVVYSHQTIWIVF